MQHKHSLALLLGIAAVCPAHAEDQKKPGQWHSSIEIGFVSTSGNTETESLNLKASTATEREKWRHKLGATVLKASDANQTTAEKYTLSGKSDYKLQKPTYLFATINYEDDRFSGFDYQASEAVGYGWRVIEQKTLELDLEIGPGARQSRLNNGQTDSEGLLRLGANLDWQVSETSKFAEAFSVEAGENSTISKSESSLTSQVNSRMSMKLSLTLKHNSDVPPGVNSMDRETSATLVYSF
jgi:putative salt-induced outer membrane protein